MDSVHLNLGAYVDDFDIAKVRLGHGFVDIFVVFDPIPEVTFCVLSRHMRIIRISRRNLKGDVRCYDSWIITVALQE
jgi:hypothetical protein